MENEESEIVNKYCSGDILDLGCGTGRLYNQLSNKGKYVGIDFEPGFINQARKTYPEGIFICQDIKHYNPDKKYDVVFAGFNTIDEIKDKEQLIVIIKSLLKPTGRFIFSAKNCFYYKVFLKNMRFKPYTKQRNGNLLVLKGSSPYKIQKYYSKHFKFIKRYGNITNKLNYYVYKMDLIKEQSL